MHKSALLMFCTGATPSLESQTQGLHLLRWERVSSRNHCRSGSLAAGVAGLGWLSAGFRSTYTLLRARFTSLYSLCRWKNLLSPQLITGSDTVEGTCVRLQRKLDAVAIN